MAQRVWSTPAQLALGFGAVLLLGGTGVFLAALFMVNAPANAVSDRYQGAIDRIVYPEFEQNWKLFAPNPAQANVNVAARVQTIGDGLHTGDWTDLTAQDLAVIRHNPVPSHADQNLLRRAWDFYDLTHPEQQAAPDSRAKLAEEYLKRIALQRLGRTANGMRILQIQFRVTSTPIDPSGEASERELPWWPVDDSDYAGLK